jgi:hypothetical protein
MTAFICIPHVLDRDLVVIIAAQAASLTAGWAVGPLLE